MRFLVHGFLALLLSIAAPVLAQQAPPAVPSAHGAPSATAPIPLAGQEQPPARVGRVSFVAGQLGFHGKGESAWSAAAVNYPVATGGSFWTDPKTRAEFRIGAQTINLSNNTEIDVARLDQQVMQIAVPQGRVELHLRRLGEGNTVEVDIPRGGVWLLQAGIYDIDAGGPSQPTRIMVFEGSARFVGGTLDIAIKAGEAAVISGSETLTAAMEKAAPDAFVQWCRSRDYQEQRLAAPYYVSHRMTGYETLDEYGAWRAIPDYGEVWYPSSVPANWVPYRHGYWSWIEPWGWNWIAAEPWGFAPFHYGRWAYIGGAWGWLPGAFVPDPVYAPALVGFIGDPASIVAARIAGALTGWFPLGPGEAFWPSYTSDPSYIRAVNAGVVTDPRVLADPATATRNFANRGAATVVTQRAFAAARSVAGAALPVSAAAAQQARATAQAPAAMRGATAAAGLSARAAAQTARGGSGRWATASGAAVSAGRVSGAARMSGFHGGGGMAFRGGGHGGSAAFHGHGGGAAFHGGGGHGGSNGGHGGVGSGGGHGGAGVAIHAGGGGGGPHGGGGGGGPHGGGGGGAPHGGGGGHGGGKGHD